MNRTTARPNPTDRIALVSVAAAAVLLLVPSRVKVPLLTPFQTVLLAPLRVSAELNRSLANLRSENRRLSELASRLAVENARLLSLAATDTLLPVAGLRLVRAPVIARDLVTFERYLIVSRGRQSRVRPGSPVIAPAGIAGKVVFAGRHQSLVQTLYATDCRVSVADKRSRVPALLRADPDGSLVLDYVPKDADYRVNDTVVTAGLGGVFPKGLGVGTVTSVPEQAAMFQPVRIRPFVNIPALQEVFILDLPDSIPGGWLDNLAPPEVAIPDQPEGE
jgi:rod shape-determining protein MreC